LASYVYDRVLYEYGIYGGGPELLFIARSGTKAKSSAFIVTWYEWDYYPYGYVYDPIVTSLALDEEDLLLIDQGISGRAALMKDHIDEMPQANYGDAPSAFGAVDTEVLTQTWLMGNPEFTLPGIAGSRALSTIIGRTGSIWARISQEIARAILGPDAGIFVRVNYPDGSFFVFHIKQSQASLDVKPVYKVSADRNTVVVIDSELVKDVEDPVLSQDAASYQHEGVFEPMVELHVSRSNLWRTKIVNCYSFWSCEEAKEYWVEIFDLN
jgi:hypothetical protein